ncbi:MAG: hypothetical protein WKG32_20905 [Gemmatimonadaceae bacterium]
MSPALFEYLQGAFGSLSGQMATGVGLSRRALELGERNESAIAQLQWHAFGSMPPAPLAKPLKSSDALMGRVSVSELEADAAKAETLVLAAKVATIENHIKAQSSAMGVTAPEVALDGRDVDDAPGGPSAFAVFLSSRAGRDFMIRVLTLVLATLTTIATGYLATRAAAPPPSSPPAMTPPAAVPR